MGIPKRVSDRITTQLKRYQSILSDANSRDISESDAAHQALQARCRCCVPMPGGRGEVDRMTSTTALNNMTEEIA
jgi:hypothetical protein